MVFIMAFKEMTNIIHIISLSHSFSKRYPHYFLDTAKHIFKAATYGTVFIGSPANVRIWLAHEYILILCLVLFSPLRIFPSGKFH